MTPFSTIFCIEDTVVLDEPTIRGIVREGYSRIPVYHGERDNITGLLMVKDLATIEPSANVTVKDVIASEQRSLLRVYSDAPLSDILREFKAGRSHLALVRATGIETREGPKSSKFLGILTLEDIIEQLINDEIIDEYDKMAQRQTKRQSRETRKSFSDDSGTRNRVSREVLTKVASFLRENVGPFKKKKMSQAALLELLEFSQYFEIDCASFSDDDSEPYLYIEDQPNSSMVVIISGKVVVSTDAGTTEVIGTLPGKDTFGYLGEKALRVARYIPDFSAKARGKLCYININRSNYTQALEFSKNERGNKIFSL